jgi:hypothetical protein
LSYHRRGTVVVLLLLVLVIGLPSSFGWGENADRLIANKAVDSLPAEMQPFFAANRQFIVQHAVNSDESGKAAGLSDARSFIQLDHYGAYPFSSLPRSYTGAVSKFTKRTVEMYGLLPWQIGIYSKKLTDAFESRNWNDAKLSAAILAHYVAAAHDPFNTTADSTGKVAGQPGINERFNTALVDRYQLFFFVKPNEAAFIRDPTDHAFDMVMNAHAWLEIVLLSDNQAHEGLASYSDQYYDHFYAQAGAVLVRQFSDASTDVGSYWMTAWINAGRPQLPSL